MALANTVANTQTDFSDKFTDVKQTTSGMTCARKGAVGKFESVQHTILGDFDKNEAILFEIEVLKSWDVFTTK